MEKLLVTSYFLLIGILISVPYTAKSERDPLQLPPLSLLQKSESIRFKDLPDPFILKHWPPIRDSERITINGVPLTKNLDYFIDYGAGTLTFLKDYPPEAIVQITYRALPFAIKKGYKRDLFRQEQPLEQAPSEVKLEPRLDLTRQRPPESALPPVQVTGTHTFGISAGSKRSLSPERTLRISVDGKVSENVSVTALLSDQNLPIQPEGTTEDIQDIDQKLNPHHKPKCHRVVG